MDLKVTQLTPRVYPVDGTDLLMIVGNTSATPTNYRVQVHDFLSGLVTTFPTSTRSSLKIVANVSGNSPNAVLACAEFIAQVNSSISATQNSRIGVIGRSIVANTSSNTTGEIAGGKFVLDVANSAISAGNSFGIIIEHTINASVTSARTVAPQAYIGIREDAGLGAKTPYLFALGINGNTVSANVSNVDANCLLSKANTTTTTVKVATLINGTVVWLHGSTVL